MVADLNLSPFSFRCQLDLGTQGLLEGRFQFQQVLTHTDQLSLVTTHIYDSKGNLTRTDYPEGTHEEWTYNSYGQVLTYRDKAGNVTTYEYNGNQDLIRITLPDETPGDPNDNPYWTLVYDSYSLLLSATDPDGNTISYTYDLMDRVTRIDYQDGSHEEIIFSSAGNDSYHSRFTKKGSGPVA